MSVKPQCQLVKRSGMTHNLYIPTPFVRVYPQKSMYTRTLALDYTNIP